MTRVANASRKTSETDIEIELNIDGTGKYEIDTGVNFFNHMLESFSRHSFIDLKIKAIGDIEIDDHHTVEDVGILLGEVFAEAIGDKKGIRRMGHAIVPMDDSVATVSSDVVVHFFESFASSGKINIYGTCEGANDHHKAEALFKAFAKSLYDGCKIEHDEILSTKGVL